MTDLPVLPARISLPDEVVSSAPAPFKNVIADHLRLWQEFNSRHQTLLEMQTPLNRAVAEAADNRERAKAARNGEVANPRNVAELDARIEKQRDLVAGIIFALRESTQEIENGFATHGLAWRDSVMKERPKKVKKLKTLLADVKELIGEIAADDGLAEWLNNAHYAVFGERFETGAGFSNFRIEGSPRSRINNVSLGLGGMTTELDQVLTGVADSVYEPVFRKPYKVEEELPLDQQHPFAQAPKRVNDEPQVPLPVHTPKNAHNKIEHAS